MNRWFLFSTLLLILSCAPRQKKPPRSDPAIGQTKKNIVEQLESENIYQGVQTSQLDSAYEEILSLDDQKYFLKSGKVVSKIRDAEEKERMLVFWRERFKGKLYRERQLKNQRSIHGHQEVWIELACDALGTGVIFDPVREQVVKVFYYESEE